MNIYMNIFISKKICLLFLSSTCINGEWICGERNCGKLNLYF